MADINKKDALVNPSKEFDKPKDAVPAEKVSQPVS